MGALASGSGVAVIGSVGISSRSYVSEHGVVGGAQPADQVLRLGVVVAAIVLHHVVAEQHRVLQRVRQLVGARAPRAVMVEQRW